MSELTLTQIKTLLRQSILFEGLTDEDLAPLARATQVISVSPTEFLIHRGDRGDSLMIVADGRVKIVTTSERGAELLLNIIEAGEAFGELAVLDGRVRSADAIALTDVIALKVGRNSVTKFLTDRPDVALRIIALLCEKLRHTTELAEESAFLAPPARLYRRLVDLARHHGRPAERGVRVVHKLSQRELANGIAASRETVNKVLQGWKQLGLVETGTGFVWIKDPAALAREAGVTGFAENVDQN